MKKSIFINAKIIKEEFIDTLYIQPAAGDAGAARQCCLAAGAAGNSKLLEQPTSIMLAGCHLTTPGAPGNCGGYDIS